MSSKKIDVSVLKQINGIAELTKNIKENENIKTEKTINFVFEIEESLIQLIRNFVHYKKFEAGMYEYNQSSVIKEGISLLKEKYPNLPARPDKVKKPTIRGRRKKSIGEIQAEKKHLTSFNITERERDFIYNFIYDKLKKGEDYIKEDFINDLLDEIKHKYKIK